MNALVSIDEFEARRPEPFAGERERKRAELILGDASALVRDIARPAGLADEDMPQAVRQIVMRLAGRAIDNPNGVASESIGDASYRLARHATNGLALSAEERAEIEAAVGLSPIWSVPVGIGYDDDRFRLFAPIGKTDKGRVDWQRDG